MKKRGIIISCIAIALMIIVVTVCLIVYLPKKTFDGINDYEIVEYNIILHSISQIQIRIDSHKEFEEINYRGTLVETLDKKQAEVFSGLKTFIPERFHGPEFYEENTLYVVYFETQYQGAEYKIKDIQVDESITVNLKLLKTSNQDHFHILLLAVHKNSIDQNIEISI